MTKLTDTQALILRTASHHPDGLAAPPASLPPAPRGAVAKALLAAGLVEMAASTEGVDAALAWKLDGETLFLRISAAGLRAIGVDAEQDAAGTAADAPAPQDTSEAGDAARDAPAAQQEGSEGPSGTDAAADTAAAPPALPTRARALRAAAQQVLAAWDDEAGGRIGLPAAIDALRAAMPAARPARQPRQLGAQRTPRTGTKQQAVLALLRRPEGASGPQMIKATGWAPHTVRGFLAGLKKRGIEVLVHDRVRQVGPGKEGAKGSYTVYRIAAEPAG